jgi:hypothetical protein
MPKQLALIAFLLSLGFFSFSQKPAFVRNYKLGEVYRYKLTCEELHDNKWESTIISVCELHVVKDTNGIYSDEIHWLSKKKFTTKDTVDEAEKAILVKPYRISLAQNGRIDLPKIEVSNMTEPIQDFNTFFVAVGWFMVDNLEKKSDSNTLKDLVKADFSNGSFILKGEDCFSVKATLTDVTKKLLTIRTDFMPPSENCFSYLLEEMKTPVIANTINNFQMVMPSGDDKYNVQYGCERFYVVSTIKKNEGKILSATMNNTLSLKLKINCDKDYKNSQFEMPFVMQRNLSLELIQ